MESNNGQSWPAFTDYKAVKLTAKLSEFLLLFFVIVTRYRVVSLVKLDSVVNVSVCRKSVECNLDGLSGISLSEVEEGSEPDDFWKAIGGKKYYCSLAHGKCFQDCSFNALTFRSNSNIEVLRA